MKSSFSKPRKNLIIKHFESYKPRERYQADVIFLYFVWDGFKYIFTMTDHFTKYGLVISLNNMKGETILKALKNVSPNIIFLIDFRQI